MKIVQPEVKEIVFHVPEGYTIEKWLEKAGRTCYKSEDKITAESAPKFIRMLRDRGHHAMLEHGMISAVISADRGLTHELVRHRIASFAQESTRYCNYGKGKFGAEITVVAQPGMEFLQSKVWAEAMQNAEKAYLALLDLKVPAQIARSVLPIGIKSEIVVSANLREWMHIFNMRADTPAHPIIRGVALEILKEFNKRLPAIYENHALRFLHQVSPETKALRKEVGKLRATIKEKPSSAFDKLLSRYS